MRVPRIHGDGEQSRDFTFVADAVAANLAAAVAPTEACGRAYNVARGQRTTVNQLTETLRKILEVEIEAIHGPPRPGDVAHSLADLSAVLEALGFSAATDLEGGLRRSVDYYRGLLNA